MHYTIHDTGKYPIERLLGAGGMGCMFLCQGAFNVGKVVVKCFWEAMPGPKEAVFREAFIMRQLPHDYFPKVYDYDYVDSFTQERPYIITEYIPETLDGEQWLTTHGALNLVDSLSVGLQISCALALAHSKGVYHLDLKPANLLLRRIDGEMQVKIIDFGLSQVAKSLKDDARSRQHRSGLSMMGQAVFGTLDYAPPEQLGDNRYGSPGAKSDLFAFGKTLYRLSSGREASSTFRRQHLAEWPMELFELLGDCVEQNPLDRPESTDKLVEAFEQALQPDKPVSLAPDSSVKQPADNTPTIITPADELSILRKQNPWAVQLDKDQFGIYADFVYNKVTQRLRWIEPGKFVMGSTQYDLEKPPHEVTLTQGFWLGGTPCTQALWQAVMGKNPSYFKGESRPVETVSWDDVQAFLKKLRELVPEFAPCLPTEAQWEYACRAGSTGKWCFGDDETLLADYAWYDKNAGGGTRPVKQKQANAFGLYDMHGNVWEWCQDWYRKYAEKPQTDPGGPASGDDRVLRGGSWRLNAVSTRCAYRFRLESDGRLDYIGFRLARGQIGFQ